MSHWALSLQLSSQMQTESRAGAKLASIPIVLEEWTHRIADNFHYLHGLQAHQNGLRHLCENFQRGPEPSIWNWGRPIWEPLGHVSERHNDMMHPQYRHHILRPLTPTQVHVDVAG